VDQLEHFREVWLADFEFSAPAGERPTPVCLVAREYFSNRLVRLFADELQDGPPFQTDENTLFVAYFASAEIGCFLDLDWDTPKRILDLWSEQRVRTNGRVGVRRSLLDTLTFYGLDSIAAVEKTELRELAMRGGPFTDAERLALLDYCQSDVDALAGLLPVMLPGIDLPRALLRGRYMAAVARMERVGVPIDTDTLCLLRQHWDAIKDQLIADVDRDYHVFEGRTFKQKRFARWLGEHRIPWPRTPHGQLALDRDTFRQQARKYPQVSALRELRHSLSEMKLEKLSVGSDDRNRCLLSPFSSRTGRNQPSNNRFIFGPSVWLRGLIKPTAGNALAYIDWSQQELGIAAALSGDIAMMQDYSSGDPYLAFAKQAGAVPSDATKDSHPEERNRFKVCALAVQYGMREQGLAQALGAQTAMARNLLQAHRDTYRSFWQWSQLQVDQAMLVGWIRTVFGWRLTTQDQTNPRSVANFPMQANGAEMLRLACSTATEAGIRVCAPVHDAILIEGPSESIDELVQQTQSIMGEASRIVLDGFELATDAELVRYPDRYMDEKRGRTMWDRVLKLARECNGERPVWPSERDEVADQNGQFVPPVQSSK
jgi:DNA polymerase-1